MYWLAQVDSRLVGAFIFAMPTLSLYTPLPPPPPQVASLHMLQASKWAVLIEFGKTQSTFATHKAIPAQICEARGASGQRPAGFGRSRAKLDTLRPKLAQIPLIAACRSPNFGQTCQLSCCPQPIWVDIDRSWTKFGKLRAGFLSKARTRRCSADLGHCSRHTIFSASMGARVSKSLRSRVSWIWTNIGLINMARRGGDRCSTPGPPRPRKPEFLWKGAMARSGYFITAAATLLWAVPKQGRDHLMDGVASVTQSAWPRRSPGSTVCGCVARDTPRRDWSRPADMR